MKQQHYEDMKGPTTNEFIIEKGRSMRDDDEEEMENETGDDGVI